MDRLWEEQFGIDWDSLAIRHGDNLPHWTCEQAVYHVSFRLADSVPEDRRRQWLAERGNILDAIAHLGREPSEDECERLRQLYSERIESFLSAGHGECLLARRAIGTMVASALEFFHGERYRLHMYCVMPNHIHVAVEPFPGFVLARTVQSWKSYTANRANHLLGREGVFWQHDSYDRIARSAEEFGALLEYIWANPGGMAAGFVRQRWNWTDADRAP